MERLGVAKEEESDYILVAILRFFLVDSRSSRMFYQWEMGRKLRLFVFARWQHHSR